MKNTASQPANNPTNFVVKYKKQIWYAIFGTG